MRQLLNTTTALIASFALVAPGPIFAQEATADALICLDGTKVPCLPGQEPLDANGAPVPDTTMTPEQQAAAKVAAEAKAAEEAAAAKAAEDAAAAQKAADDAAAAEAQAKADAEAKVAADAKAAEDAAAAQKAADDAAAQKATDDAAAAQKAADDAAKAADDAAAQKAADDAAAAKAADDAAAQKAADDAATQKAADDAAAAQKAADDAAAQKAADDAVAQKAADDAAAAAAAAPATDGAPSTDDLAKALADQAGVTPAPAADAVPVPELPVQPEAESGAAPVAEAATLPVADTATDANAAPPADVTVTEETVAPDAVRKSDEDFANKVNEASPAAAAPAATAAAPAVTTDKKKNRLTDAEKVILLGLGAVAVGAILSNNRKVQLNSGDRVVVMRDDGTQQVIKDDDALIRRPGDRVRTERFTDGSTRTTVLRADGSRIVTIRDAEYRVLRRVLVDDLGYETVLIDDTVQYEPVIISQLPKPRRHPVIEDTSDEDALRAALADQGAFSRRFSLSQVRNIREVRDLVPVIDLNAITFASGSAAISPDQAQALSGLGRYIRDTVRANPREVFLIEGHTDAVGNAAYNLALSDRRAESVALALTEYFRVPPENLVVQGYGEEFLRINTQGDERLNRRASVRRITDLLRQAAAE